MADRFAVAVDVINRGMGLIPKVPAQAGSVAGRPHAIGWKQGRQVAIPLPMPAQAGYERALERADRFREHVSPLGGTAEWPWSQRPPVGEGSLRPEFRRSARR
jgi:hypothetical protein